MKDARNRTRLNHYDRNMLFIRRGIYVQPGARCCEHHFYNGQLSHEAIFQITPANSELVAFDSSEIQNITTDFRLMSQNQQTFDFDNPSSLDDTAYLNITGLTKGKNILSRISCMLEVIFLRISCLFL